MNCSDSWPNASMQHLISRRTLPMEARSNPLPAEKSLQGDRTLVLQDRLVPACRVLSFRSQAAPEGNTLQRKGSLMEYSFKSKQVALTFAEFTGTMKGPMTMADCKVIAPTNKSFKVDFCTVAHSGMRTARSWKKTLF